MRKSIIRCGWYYFLKTNFRKESRKDLCEKEIATILIVEQRYEGWEITCVRMCTINNGKVTYEYEPGKEKWEMKDVTKHLMVIKRERKS